MSNDRDFRPRFVDEGDQGLIPSLGFFTALAGMFVAFVATAPPAEEPTIENQPASVTDTLYWHIPTVIEASARPVAPVPAPAPGPAPKVKRQPVPRTAAIETSPGPVSNPLLEIVTHGKNFEDRYSPEAIAGMIHAIPSAPPDGTVAGPRQRAGATPDRRPEPGPRPPRSPIPMPSPTDPSPPPPVITPDPPTGPPPGHCREEAIRSVVKASHGQLKGCYEGELRRNPSLSGRLVLSWNVEDGAVVSAHASENETGSPSFASCVERRVRSWRFAKDCNGEIEWGFLFAPK